ncbi:MAG: restriction endonuclease [Desulfatiglans sp.]|nr:restriction endonuclease [Desulfatiglans sp.]
MSPHQTIELVEFETRYFQRSNLPEEEAQRIYIQYGDKVNVEWPTLKTQYKWRLTSLGWVGYIPLANYGGISLKPKVTLRNLFGMLEYAYDLKSFKLLEGHYESNSIRDFYERLATVLAERVLKRIRQGLYRTYIEEHTSLSFVRGKLDLGVLCSSPVRSRVVCYSEDHTLDIEDNQILAWTLHNIVRSGLLTREKPLNVARKADRILRNSISLKCFTGIGCANRTYNRLNADYEILHKLCRFFLDNTGPTQDTGGHSMIPFLVDMAHLFELFVSRWLEEKIDSRYLVQRQESLYIGKQSTLRMQMDILISDRQSQKPLCVLDTKYKRDNSVSPSDYYQVVAYADAVSCQQAALIYPSESLVPFDAKPGGIRVRTIVFDLGTDLDDAGKKFIQTLYSILENAA